MLSKSLSTSAKRARLHRVLGPTPAWGGGLAEFAQALYPLLIAHSDDWGREPGDPFTVKTAIDPSSPRSLLDFAEALLGLHTVGLIQLYEDGDRYLLQIVDFESHQRGLHKRVPSSYPEPPSCGTSGNFPEIPGISGKYRSRARAELELELELEVQNARAAPTTPPQPVQKSLRPAEKPKVSTLAALFRTELLPRGITDEGDLTERAKVLAARHRLRYTGSTIRRALASARGQLAKRRD